MQPRLKASKLGSLEIPLSKAIYDALFSFFRSGIISQNIFTVFSFQSRSKTSKALGASFSPFRMGS